MRLPALVAKICGMNCRNITKIVSVSSIPDERSVLQSVEDPNSVGLTSNIRILVPSPLPFDLDRDTSHDFRCSGPWKYAAIFPSFLCKFNGVGLVRELRTKAY